MSEIEWRVVPTLPGYEASNTGVLRTYWEEKSELIPLPVRPGRKPRRPKLRRWLVRMDLPIPVPIRPSKKDGYQWVRVWYGKKTRMRPLASIILEAFGQRRPIAFYMDGDRSNCRIENLRWASYEEAYSQSVAMGRRTRVKLTPGKAAEIKRRAMAGENSKALALEFGIRQSMVCNIKSGRVWKAV